VIEQLLNHIRRNLLCKTTDKILLAVSGGLDSVVMLHLMKEAGFRIAVAHCNFQLRGAESDIDQEFVNEACRQLKVPFFVKKFQTNDHATSRGISIQMAARELRYEFFAELRREHGFDLVATAHHFNDTIESVFLNLVRGTGMDGLRGIATGKDNIIRPLMFATREMIHDYARQHNITWREDASNASDDYQRNFLRHEVIPRLVEMNPAFEEGFRQTHERLLGAREFALEYISGLRSSAVVTSDDKSMTLDIRKIRQSVSPAVLLWELIKEMGFKYDQCRKITLDHQPGKLFLSDTHQLLVDRTQYIIDRKQKSDFLSQMIGKGQKLAGNPPSMLAMKEIDTEDFSMSTDPSMAQLDADLLQFPLLWRKWQAGDYFVPLGMRSEKKVSDFLIDLKVPFNSKADITVLESGAEIVCIIGHRISDRYKVTPDTRHVLVIEPKSASD
jgi:tRNA(Ile)-lysidine synthase